MGFTFTNDSKKFVPEEERNNGNFLCKALMLELDWVSHHDTRPGIYHVVKLSIFFMSACFEIMMFFTQVIDQKALTFCSLFDTFLILAWYLKINTTIYLDGVAVSDRRMILRSWLSSTSLWDGITLIPFEVLLE